MYRTVKETFQSHNVLSAEVEHNGEMGRDSLVKVTLKDEGCTEMYIEDEKVQTVSFELHGGAERETLIQALEFILTELKENR